MSDWPEDLTVGPIREWPGTLTAERRPSAFRTPSKYDSSGKWAAAKPVSLATTLSELDRELTAVRAQNPELLVAIDTAQFRRDGRPYANARATHPGIILSFTIPKVGDVSYPCDTFTTWEDNLRAVVLALEALRKVDRYGVTKRGEQYRGFLAIEATAAPQGFSTAREAQDFIRRVAGYDIEETWTPRLFRDAQRATHPDHGGDAALFQRVSLAEAKLREAGLL